MGSWVSITHKVKPILWIGQMFLNLPLLGNKENNAQVKIIVHITGRSCFTPGIYS
jgi:hypothetical protein